MLATKRDGDPDLPDSTGLRLLSLDGGGVRGLSTLYILKGLMTRLNHGHSYRLKPCEIFDLIGGTGTGGLIAIMLGRLELNVEDCILNYEFLMKEVFGAESGEALVPWEDRTGLSARLAKAMKEVIKGCGAEDADLFYDKQERACKVFVCATAKETSGITRLRSYSLPDEPDWHDSLTICEAALATSAATSFFDPVSIGNRQFVDGALGANNPVDEVELEASDIWCPVTGDLKPLVKCFVSIGTGNLGKRKIEDTLPEFLSRTLVQIATETEYTESKFIARWRRHFDENRYFRFNVEQGLQDVGFAEHKEQGKIDAATMEYLGHQQQRSRVRKWVGNLTQRETIDVAKPSLVS